MKNSPKELRTKAIVELFKNHGDLSSAQIAQLLGLQSTSVYYHGRKLQHIIGDLSYDGIICRTSETRSSGKRHLPVFSLNQEKKVSNSLQFNEKKTNDYSKNTLHKSKNLLNNCFGSLGEGRKFGAAENKPISEPVTRIVPKQVPGYPLIGKQASASERIQQLHALRDAKKTIEFAMILDVLQAQESRIAQIEKLFGALAHIVKESS
jgi:DNA-binding CsgD family transcriptional regulator